MPESEILHITDPYEARAWEAYLGWVDTGRDPGVVERGLRGMTSVATGVGSRVREQVDGTAAGVVLDRAGTTLGGIWSSDRVQDIVDAALATIDGAYATAVEASLRSLDPTDVLVHYDDLVTGSRVEELRELPLRVLDRRRPPLEARTQLRFAATSAATGTVQGMTSVTGVLSAGAIAADIVASIGLSARATAVQLAHYGYDVTRRAEHAYVLTLMQTSLVESAVEQALLTSRARSLALAMSRGRTWADQHEQLLARLAHRAFRVVGERMARRRLARLIPGVAAIVGAGQGYRQGRLVVDAAFHEGRARLLRDRWGDPDASFLLDDGVE